MLRHSGSIFIGVNQPLANVEIEVSVSEIGRVIYSVIKTNKQRLWLPCNAITPLTWQSLREMRLVLKAFPEHWGRAERVYVPCDHRKPNMQHMMEEVALLLCEHCSCLAAGTGSTLCSLDAHQRVGLGIQKGKGGKDCTRRNWNHPSIAFALLKVLSVENEGEI